MSLLYTVFRLRTHIAGCVQCDHRPPIASIPVSQHYTDNKTPACSIDSVSTVYYLTQEQSCWTYRSQTNP